MRFSICVLEPEGYKYSHFLYDVCKFMCYSIEAAGCECCMVKNILYSDRINVLMGAHNLTDPSSVQRIQRAGRYVIIQSEVLREDGSSGWPNKQTWPNIYLPLLQQAAAVWDGLESNRIQLKKFGVDADDIPLFGYLKSMEEINHKKNKDIDFLYYGSLTPHRKKLIDELIALGGKVVCIFDDAVIFRNDLIARTKVNLAPNQASGINHITSKILYLLNNRSIVVVERCFNQDWIEHCFPFADTDKWATLCMETLHRPDLDQLAEANYEQYKKLDLSYRFRPMLEKLRLETSEPLKGSIVGTGEAQKYVETPLSETDFQLPSFKEPQAEPDLTSIIIITHNSLDQIKRCLKSIRKNTPEAHEIIFVDNGSTDGTIKWLHGQVRENKNYQLIENKANIGQAKGCNQGINLSKGEFIVLMDNDVVVSEGWLTGMLECLNHTPDAGIVGPMTNNGAGIQQAADESYQTVNYLDKYATQYKERFHHRRIPCRNLDGFCLLFKRTLAECIGLFDERFHQGQCEDEDFCIRAALAGYRNYLAGDVFVLRRPELIIFFPDRSILEDKWTLTMDNPEGKKLALLKAVEYAELLHSKGKDDQAVEALVNCIKFSPDTKEIYYELARIFVESKKFSEAWEVVGTMPEEAKISIKGLELAGYAREGLGLDNEAMDFAEKILTSDNFNPSALNLKGILAFKKDQVEEAQEYFQKAIQSDPGFGEPYTNLGVLYWKMGKKEEALEHLRKGFILSPTVPDNSNIYYSVLSSLDKFNEARSDFGEASRLYPHHKNIAFLYIDILIRQGNMDDAMLRIEDALASFGPEEALAFLVDEQLNVSPDYTPALIFKAAFLCLKGEVDKSDEYFESLKREKGNVSPQFNKFTEHLMNNGKNNEALIVLNAVVQNRINDAETNRLLAQITVNSFAAQEIFGGKNLIF